VSGFDPAWLALREAADARARAATLLETRLARRRDGAPLRILDLATGTGSNLRYLAPRIGGRQAWLLTDVDRRLLDTLPDAMRSWASSRGYRLDRGAASIAIAASHFHCEVATLRIDLAQGLARLPVRGRDLVTASALLDLVSAPWIAALVAACRAARAELLFALSYDGRVAFEPPLADDRPVIRLVNRHQRTDKGFGPALGPTAPEVTADRLRREGYRVLRRASDWRIESDETELQGYLLRGWAQAASEMAPAAAERVNAWHARRLDRLSQGLSRISVGHQDLLGLRD
jgi:SAM-dependent methyltransferase